MKPKYKMMKVKKKKDPNLISHIKKQKKYEMKKKIHKLSKKNKLIETATRHNSSIQNHYSPFARYDESEDSNESDEESESSEFDFTVKENENILSEESSSDEEDGYSPEIHPYSPTKPYIEPMSIETETDEKDAEKDLQILNFMATNSSCFIVAVKHPETLSVKGSMCVKVISGEINILGYNFSATSNEAPLYSIPPLLTLEISTKSCEPKTVEHCREIKNRLSNIATQKVQEAVISSCKDSHVILVLRQNFDTKRFAMAQNYIPLSLYVPLKESKVDYNPMAKQGFVLCPEDTNAIKFSDYHDKVVDVIKQNLYASTTLGISTPCILVYGNRGLGKSTSLRYFINKLLSWKLEQILFLDVDPGQCEFTTPGCVSLTKVTDPLLGPAYTHLKTPIKRKFFGNVSLDSSKDYFNYIAELVDYYKENFANEILFINTAGWIKGFGKSTLEYIQALLSITVEVQLVHPKDFISTNFKSGHLFQSQAYPQKLSIPGYVSKKTQTIPPSTLRAISLLTYFGSIPSMIGDKFTTFPSTLNEITPYRISALDVAIHVIDCSELDSLKLLILNCAVIALCIVPPSQINHCVSGSVPKRLVPGSDCGDCIGFGFVRAIDPQSNSLYIITPVHPVKLRYVNLLVKGNVQMPDEVFTKQKLKNVESVPYMGMKTSKSKLSGKICRRRYRSKS